MKAGIINILGLILCTQLFSGCTSDVTGYFLVEKQADGKPKPISLEDFTAISREMEIIVRRHGFEVFRHNETTDDGRLISQTCEAALGPKGQKPVNIYAAVSSPTRLSVTWSPRETTVTAKGIEALGNDGRALMNEFAEALHRVADGKEITLSARKIYIQN